MWAYYALMAALAAYGTYSAVTADKGMPQRPAMSPPDFAPLQQFGDFTAYQNSTRNQLLAEYYGGKVGSSGLSPREDISYQTGNLVDDFGGTEAGSRGRSWTDANYREYTPDPATSRSTVSLTGTKPMRQYKSTQQGILNDSQKGFSDELAKYYADRGIAPEGQVAGVQNELNKDYSQKNREITSRSHDIYAMTLGSLFGEVSDAGAQSGQLVGNVGLAAQSDAQARQASYAQAMQKWQYDQNQPSVAGAVGSMLPYLYGMATSGSGAPPATNSPYGPYASGYQYPPGGAAKLPWE